MSEPHSKDALITASASQALTWMRAGNLTAEAYAEACLERIAQRDDVVHAGVRRHRNRSWLMHVHWIVKLPGRGGLARFMGFRSA